MENNKAKKIMLSGGGTGGSVTPLLAVAAELLKEQTDLHLVFVGAKHGPEKELVANFKEGEIKFISIPSGKWRRYLSLHNFLDVFKIMAAFFKSLSVLHKEKPLMVMSAGSFVSVPLVWAAACRRIPILIHQQDIRPGLANKLMAPFARVISVTFEKSLTDYGPRAALTGNPLKDISRHQANVIATRKQYGFRIDKPLVLVVGGGTGAVAINNLIKDALPSLLPVCQIAHLTGHGKKPVEISANEEYKVFEFLDQGEVLALMATSDVVLSRSGLGVLTELSALAKPAILIPIPRSHQEDNAAIFRERAAAIVLSQTDLDAKKLSLEIEKVLADAKLRGSLSHNIQKIIKREAAQNIAALIWEMIKKHK
jgi:UDP-N-acetylglucosamine--N-acetylmuramyl-(pentapeptide) pyrophosphoryl-undecaprenol N-acetylglucosamine transferase